MKSKLLGSTEQKIMSFFWHHHSRKSIAELHRSLIKKEPIAYTTVATIVGRLVEKKLLTRSKSGRNYVYSCTQTKDEFMVGKSRGLIRTLLGNFGEVAVVGFVEELRTDPISLKKLRELANEPE